MILPRRVREVAVVDAPAAPVTGADAVGFRDATIGSVEPVDNADGRGADGGAADGPDEIESIMDCCDDNERGIRWKLRSGAGPR